MGLAARFALVFVSTALYLGLAVLGWGGAPFFASPARIAVVILTFAMATVAMFAGGNLSSGVREDRANRWVLPAFGVLGLLAGFLPAWTDRIDFWTFDGETIRWLGVAVFAAGGAVRIWPVFVLGNRFSGLVAIQPGHMLVTAGVYAHIRHPSYLGMLLTAVGWSLAFRSVVGLVLCALLIPPLLARIQSEERLLDTQFREEYRAYVRRTSRLLPGIY